MTSTDQEERPTSATAPARARRQARAADVGLVVLCAAAAAAVPFTGLPPWSVPLGGLCLAAAVVLLSRPDAALRLALLVVLLPPGLLPPVAQTALETGSILVAAGGAALASRPRAPGPPLPLAVWVLGAFLVWSLLSTWWSDQPAGGLDLLRRYAVALLLLVVVLVRTRGPEAVDRFLQTLALSGWVLLSCGLWAVVTGARTPDGRLDVLEMNPNQVGNVLLLVTAGVMWRAVWPGGRPGPTLQAVLFLACALALIGATGSRGSLLAYVLLLLGFLATRALRVWGVGVALLGLTLLLVTPGVFGTVLQRFQEQDPDQLSRPTLWAAGLSLVADHPLGVGVGRGPYAMPAYIDARVAQDHFQDRDEYPAHNPFLEVATDSGVVGGLLFAGAVAAAAGTAVRSATTAHRRRDRHGRTYAAVTGTSSLAFFAVWLKSGGESYSFTTFVLLAMWLLSARAAARTGP